MVGILVWIDPGDFQSQICRLWSSTRSTSRTTQSPDVIAFLTSPVCWSIRYRWFHPTPFAHPDQFIGCIDAMQERLAGVTNEGFTRFVDRDSRLCRSAFDGDHSKTWWPRWLYRNENESPSPARRRRQFEWIGEQRIVNRNAVSSPSRLKRTGRGWSTGSPGLA